MTQTLSPGFADPVRDSQACFRAVLDAMARPGRVHEVAGVQAPAPLCDAAAAVLLTLADNETPLWLDAGAQDARGWIAFHTGAPTVEPDAAIFAMALSLPDLSALCAGTDEAPETSATVILQVTSLRHGRRFTLEGPGIRKSTDIRIDGLPDDFVRLWHDNRALFPRGVDLILCAGNTVAALPRGVSVLEV